MPTPAQANALPPLALRYLSIPSDLTPFVRFFVLAKTDASASTGKAFTGFIVDADSDGLTLGRKVRDEA